MRKVPIFIWDLGRKEQGGSVGIGVSNPAEKLEVNGNVVATEFQGDVDATNVTADKVILNIGSFPDYVFSDTYQLMSLQELETYIKVHQKLPNMPSEQDVIENGLNLKQINTLLVEKVEELTLHTIEVNKKNAQLEKQLKDLMKKIEGLINN